MAAMRLPKNKDVIFFQVYKKEYEIASHKD
jgi:hypothetical protein